MERACGAIWKIAGKLPVAFSNRTAGAFMFSHAGGLCRVKSLCFLLFGIFFCGVSKRVVLFFTCVGWFLPLTLRLLQIFLCYQKHKF